MAEEATRPTAPVDAPEATNSGVAESLRQMIEELIGELDTVGSHVTDATISPVLAVHIEAALRAARNALVIAAKDLIAGQ